MATREIVHVVCDMHADPEVAGAPVRFGIDGQAWELDACPECAARLRGVLAEFIRHARPAGAMTTLPPRRSNRKTDRRSRPPPP